MTRRPIPNACRQWLTGELQAWQSSGILGPEQPGRILDLYETSAETADRRRSLAVYAVSGIATFLIGLAALLIVGYNWNGMSAVEKLAVIFVALVGLHGAAFGLRTHEKRLTSEIVFFLACMIYGTSIWLIAQIFNIHSHYPDGIWIWALGVLPFALCLDTLLLHALYAGLLAVWVGCEILGFQGIDPWLFQGFYVPRGAWTLPLMVAPGLWWAYRHRSALAVGLYAPLLAWWAVLQPAAWQWGPNPIYFVGLAGALLLIAAEMHREESPMARPYRFYGILITGGVLVPMSFGDVLDIMQHDGNSMENYAAGLTVALLGAAASLGVVLFQQRERGTDWRALLQRQWFPLLMILLLAGLCVWSGIYNQYDGGPSGPRYYSHDINRWSAQILVPLAAVNAMMIVLALWMMRVGLREDRTLPFAAGVLYFLFWSILRYADLFAGVGGMLGAALMFLLCGVGLLAVARFWLHRKGTIHD